MPAIDVTEAGRRGGTRTRDTHGPDYYRRIGRLGAERLRELVARGLAAEQTGDPPPEAEQVAETETEEHA